MTKGARVSLVGAGPGDPGLITARGLELVRSCDVLLYDRLVDPELIDEAPAGAERIFVGKKPGEVHSRQVVADALMVDRASAGAHVVRLKGGDPFVFGKGAEELLILSEAKIPFEVVPGVTSAVAAPSYAGIPLTHKGVAASFAVVAANKEADVNIDALATGADTLVLMMGVRALGSTASRLIDAGRSPDTPAAMIEWGASARQRVVVGSLKELPALCKEAGIKAPATAIVGDVVKLRDTISWFERRALHGMRVVVTRAPRQARALGGLLADRGASVLYLPVIDIGDPASLEDLDLAIKKLCDGLYTWVVFTSSNGILKFFQRLGESGHDARAFGRTKVAVVGAASAGLLEQHGIRADFVPERFTGEELAKSMDRGTGRVLLPRVENAPDDIPKILKTAGFTPEDCATYSNLLGPRDTPQVEAVRAGGFDVVTFASASAVNAFVEIVGDPESIELHQKSDGVRFVACIGPRAADAARAAGMRVDVVPEVHTTEGLVDALGARFAT